MHSYAIWNDVLEVGTGEKLLKIRTLTGAYQCYWFHVSEVGTGEKLFKTRLLNGAFCLNLKRCKMRCRLSLSNFRHWCYSNTLCNSSLMTIVELSSIWVVWQHTVYYVEVVDVPIDIYRNELSNESTCHENVDLFLFHIK